MEANREMQKVLFAYKIKLVELLNKIKLFGNYSQDNAFGLQMIFDEYESILKELCKIDGYAHYGEVNAFSDMYSIIDLMFESKSIKRKKEVYNDTKSGLLTDLDKIIERLTIGY